MLHAVVHWEVLWCANRLHAVEWCTGRCFGVLIGLSYCFRACVQAKVDRLIRAACIGALEGALVCC